MTVTIYSTSTCSACQVLMQWLDQQKISYEHKITDEDTAAMAEFMSVNDGLVGVPFTVITADDGTETKISGYDQPKFKQALGLN